MTMLIRFLSILATLLYTQVVFAELPGEGPRLGHDRVSQADIESGSMGLKEIRKAGLKMFTTPFNKQDGYGDGPMNPDNTTEPGGRPTLGNNGTFLRVNGLDGQTCHECHSITSNASVPAKLGVGGVGGSVTNAIFQPTLIDVDDSMHLQHAAMDGRFINPPFLFGSGGIELLGKEMTAELQHLKEFARQNPGVAVALKTKGVSFGELVYDGAAYNYDGVSGIDTDLVVRPFGRKGEFPTIRSFDEAAMMFHFGMQPVEAVGVDIDDDKDGVVNEILPGELTALAVFNTTLERPVNGRRNHAARKGFNTFKSIGCASCHKPVLRTDSEVLTYSLPEVAEDPSANVFLEVNLAKAPARFPKAKHGGLAVPLFADLKRHDMGARLGEFFGHPLDRQFTTARLWGVADTAPYMHDGRALTIGSAIDMHGGEAQDARDQYVALAETDKANLLEFLHTLRTPANPVKDLLRSKKQE